MHFDNKGMLGLFEDIALCDGVLKVLVPVQKCFLEYLHRKFLSLPLKIALKHFSKSTVAKYLLNLKWLESDPLHDAIIHENCLCFSHLLHIIRWKLLPLLHFLHAFEVTCKVRFDYHSRWLLLNLISFLFLHRGLGGFVDTGLPRWKGIILLFKESLLRTHSSRCLWSVRVLD